MELEIIIKGGEELEEYYPKHYEVFREKIGDLIMEFFPGVEGWFFSSELTRYSQAAKDRREQQNREEIRQSLKEIFKDPEFLAEMREPIKAES